MTVICVTEARETKDSHEQLAPCSLLCCVRARFYVVCSICRALNVLTVAFRKARIILPVVADACSCCGVGCHKVYSLVEAHNFARAGLTPFVSCFRTSQSTTCCCVQCTNRNRCCRAPAAPGPAPTVARVGQACQSCNEGQRTFVTPGAGLLVVRLPQSCSSYPGCGSLAAWVAAPSATNILAACAACARYGHRDRRKFSQQTR